MDLVSVIIPYYKKRNFIKETIVSVTNQSYNYLEILIVYDDTNLNDLEFLQEISKLDKRIKIINNFKRLGAGLSRNKGIEQSNGKYIAFIDADDTWAPDKLKDQISFMKKNNHQISHTSYFIVNEKKKIIGQRKARDLLSINEVLKSCDIGLSTVIIEKKVITIIIKKNRQPFIPLVLMIKIKYIVMNI